jgi:hypothetical protein
MWVVGGWRDEEMEIFEFIGGLYFRFNNLRF